MEQLDILISTRPQTTTDLQKVKAIRRLKSRKTFIELFFFNAPRVFPSFVWRPLGRVDISVESPRETGQIQYISALTRKRRNTRNLVTSPLKQIATHANRTTKKTEKEARKYIHMIRILKNDDHSQEEARGKQRNKKTKEKSQQNHPLNSFFFFFPGRKIHPSPLPLLAAVVTGDIFHLCRYPLPAFTNEIADSTRPSGEKRKERKRERFVRPLSGWPVAFDSIQKNLSPSIGAKPSFHQLHEEGKRPVHYIPISTIHQLFSLRVS